MINFFSHYKLYTIRLSLLVTTVFILLPLSAMGQEQNELSFQAGLVRGGMEPDNFFDGHFIGVSYKHQIIPHIYLNTGLSVSTLFQKVDDWPAINNHSSFVRTEVGMEIAPLELNRFQLRLSAGGSLQNRATTNFANPHNKFSGVSSITDSVTSNYQYRSRYLGYKFELILQFQITDRMFIAPLGSMRAYPKGDFWTPNSLDVGIRAGIKI